MHYTLQTGQAREATTVHQASNYFYTKRSLFQTLDFHPQICHPLKAMLLPNVVDPIAYFSAEIALDNDLPTYSGGLGIVTGDVLNAAATSHFPMVGVGILYKGKEFVQHITGDGREEMKDSEFDHDTSFLRPTTIKGKPLLFNLPVPGGNEVKVKSYHLRLSDTTIVFFLSTDVDGNPPEWTYDMDALYHGNINSQIRQQILLGVGGVKLLSILGIKPKIYHINEGRPSFLIWELTANIMKEEKVQFEEAYKKAKEKIVYTNHTLVAAGNLNYPKETISWWAQPFAKNLKLDTDLLIKDGLLDPQIFSITLYALNTSKKHSGVSKIHTENARRAWPNYEWMAITNGVHLDRWQDSDFRNSDLKDADIWSLHSAKKKELAASVIKRTGFGYDPERLVVSWARRLAEYKQPKVIFEDIERLKKILSKEDMPIQLLFAGNSHSADPHSKSLIEEIIRLFSNQLSGHAIFVPNYNISLANHMVSGSDIWLNTPKGNLEACGTSGMKAVGNGVLNCTVLDGWTYEVNWEGVGWTLDPQNVAQSFYRLLENEIAPLYYTRDENGTPKAWIQRMRKSIEISKQFSAERVLEEYKKQLY